MTRLVRPTVLRQRIVARLDRECAQVNACSDEEWQTVPAWRQGYLAGLRIARGIVRESGE